jgi:CPA1 family monovalent cation:H+ antiporter
MNHRFMRLLVLSVVIIGLDIVGVSHALRRYEESLLRSIDFSAMLIQGMLSLLLFAGSLHVNLSEL